MSPPRSTTYKKLVKTLGLQNARHDKEFISTIVENKTQIMANKITYNMSLKLTDSRGKDLGDEIASGSTSVGEEGCIFHDHAATICFHGQGTISLVVSGTNVTDNSGRYNQIGTFIVSKIVNGSGAFLGKRDGYVITEIVDDKKRNNYVYFINNASQAEVDGIANKLENVSNLVNEAATQISALETDVSTNVSTNVSTLQASITDLQASITALQATVSQQTIRMDTRIDARMDAIDDHLGISTRRK